jgi:hypothetical protein
MAKNKRKKVSFRQALEQGTGGPFTLAELAEVEPEAAKALIDMGRGTDNVYVAYDDICAGEQGPLMLYWDYVDGWKSIHEASSALMK